MTWNQNSLQAANQAALSQCATVSNNCSVVVRFWNNCGAYATGMNDRWGYGFGVSRTAAENAAVLYSNQHDSGCRVMVWGCNTRASTTAPFSGETTQKGDPDRNRQYAEESRRWGVQEQYDRVCP